MTNTISHIFFKFVFCAAIHGFRIALTLNVMSFNILFPVHEVLVVISEQRSIRQACA